MGVTGTSNLQPLRVAVGVEAANDIATSSGPLLVGQDQATANSIGDFNVSNLILEATPGPYILNVSLLDQPQVMALHLRAAVAACSCILCFTSELMEICLYS